MKQNEMKWIHIFENQIISKNGLNSLELRLSRKCSALNIITHITLHERPVGKIFHIFFDDTKKLRCLLTILSYMQTK